MSQQPATALTRQELFDLVWSMPVLRAADRFGVSDVALAKLCRRRQVPLPPRGYWARKEAGQDVERPVLPDFVPAPPSPARITAAEQREMDRKREAEEQARALEDKHTDLPLVCFEADVAKALDLPLRRLRRLVTDGCFPINQLPYYGLSARPRRGGGKDRHQAKPVWSKFAILRFLTKPDWERSDALRTSYEQEASRCTGSCPVHCPRPRREHQYVRYLRNRNAWWRR